MTETKTKHKYQSTDEILKFKLQQQTDVLCCASGVWSKGRNMSDSSNDTKLVHDVAHVHLLVTLQTVQQFIKYVTLLNYVFAIRRQRKI